MKYTMELEIAKPLQSVIDSFDSIENMYKWQPELKSFEHLSGTPGEVGSKSTMNYQMGKRTYEMIETITEKDLPDRFAGTYEVKGMLNKVLNEFAAVDEERTLWKVTSEFIPGNFISKLMVWFMPKAFKKQTRLFMQRFKEFAEQS